jgi:hypothetical protein
MMMMMMMMMMIRSVTTTTTMMMTMTTTTMIMLLLKKMMMTMINKREEVNKRGDGVDVFFFLKTQNNVKSAHSVCVCVCVCVCMHLSLSVRVCVVCVCVCVFVCVSDAPYGQLPYIVYNGKKYAQALAIGSFLARKFGTCKLNPLYFVCWLRMNVESTN